MIGYKSFTNCFPDSFPAKLLESIVPFDAPIEHELILRELYTKIHNFTYHPSPPRDYILINKSKGVARISPTFSAIDYYSYYFCTRIFEDEIAVNHTPGTFGGWRIGNQLLSKEKDGILEILGSAPDNSFNPYKWKEEWSKFQREAAKTIRGDYKCVVKLDIANFYDSINLHLLKDKMYSVIVPQKLIYLNLLIHFLSHWNKRIEGYATKFVGIPQDELSDSSRLLANFYLQDYDAHMFKLCNNINAQYLRYADDQIIYANNRTEAEYLVFESSKYLSKIGLNLNTAKVKYFENQFEYSTHWAFEIFNLLTNKSDSKHLNAAFEKYLFWKENKYDFKEQSLLKAFINCNFSLFKSNNRTRLIELLFQDDFIQKMNNWQMKRLYDNLSEENKKIFLSKTWSLIPLCNFNHYHYNLMKFYNKANLEFNEEYLINRINELKVTHHNTV